ncbi:MAG: acyl-CoA dehydrogenase, partial [Planctomycetes bacterium]|nr:acyl-CoA dehydrogenase [Planctomycetota bacterium]
MSEAPTPESVAPEGAQSTAAQALAAAGDVESARDVGALDDAALAAQRKLGSSKRALVERLIYGPQPAAAELQSGARMAKELRGGQKIDAVVDAALGCLARGEAFTAEHALSTELRRAVAAERAYGFT